MTEHDDLEAFWAGMSRVTESDKQSLQRLVADCKALGAVLELKRANLMLKVPCPDGVGRPAASFLGVHGKTGAVWASGFLRRIADWGVGTAIAADFYRELRDLHTGFGPRGVSQHDARRGAGVQPQEIGPLVPAIKVTVKRLLSAADSA